MPCSTSGAMWCAVCYKSFSLAGHCTATCGHAWTCCFCASQAAARRKANKAAKRLRRLADVSAARAAVVGQRATSAGSVLGVTEAPRKAANFRFTIEPARKMVSRSTAHTDISHHCHAPKPKLTIFRACGNLVSLAH